MVLIRGWGWAPGRDAWPQPSGPSAAEPPATWLYAGSANAPLIRQLQLLACPLRSHVLVLQRLEVGKVLEQRVQVPLFGTRGFAGRVRQEAAAQMIKLSSCRALKGGVRIAVGALRCVCVWRNGCTNYAVSAGGLVSTRGRNGRRPGGAAFAQQANPPS